ncbi:MAG: FAD-dependent oxidoreductase, partial [Myxococcota bacterium]
MSLRVAVVGSGISGLTAAWLLNRAGHRTVLFERRDRVGMDAHSAEMPAGPDDVGVDVPVRVFNRRLWPSLSALADELEVPSRAVDVASSFSEQTGETFFRYGTVNAASVSFPYVPLRYLSARCLAIIAGVTQFRLSAGLDLHNEALSDRPLRDYLAAGEYGETFVEDFLYPAIGTICTCSRESVAEYPARVIIRSLFDIFLAGRLRRFNGGTRQIVRRLVDNLPDIRLGVGVQAIEPSNGHIDLKLSDGTERFDHVVVATQANHAIGLLTTDAKREQSILDKFRYDQLDVVVHTDPSLMPQNKKDWASVNFFVTPDRDQAASTLWVNRVEVQFEGHAPVFQTHNPLVPPAPDKEVLRVTLQR